MTIREMGRQAARDSPDERKNVQSGLRKVPPYFGIHAGRRVRRSVFRIVPLVFPWLIFARNSMRKGTPDLPDSSKRPGEIQVRERDLVDLLNTDIREFEIIRSLRRLGAIRVTEWDFKDVLPAVRRVARQEIDLVDVVKRVANYKVMDWDFRSVLASDPQSARPETAESMLSRPLRRPLAQAEIQAIIVRLKNFLQYVAVNLIGQPHHAQIKVREIGPSILRFKLVLVKKDVSMLIGMEGFTAAAIRSILKAAGARYGVRVLLQIHSHEEEIELMAREEAGLGKGATSQLQTQEKNTTL